MREQLIAENLESATNRQLLHVDGDGRVRSTLRFRLLSGSYYALLAALLASVGVLGYRLHASSPLAGLALLAAANVVVVWGAWVLTRAMKTARAVELFARDEIEEAVRHVESVAGAPLIGPIHRSRALQNLAVFRAAQGRHEEALVLVERALSSRFWRRKPLYAQLGRYQEVLCLVNVGRVADAQRKLASIGAAPSGDFLRIAHWTAELYVALATGETTLSESELETRARAALEITSAASLLGLLAWALDRRGDAEMSAHLLREALDRHPGRRLSGALPLLDAWMNEHRPSLEAE